MNDLHVQREQVRGESTCYFVQALTPLGQRILEAYRGEINFYGRGAKAQAEKALRLAIECFDLGF